MQRMYFCSLKLSIPALLLSSAVWGQSPPCEKESVTSKVHGVKIVSYAHDPKAHYGTVTFQNDSKKDIEFVHGEVVVTREDGRVETERQLDVVLDVDYRTAGMKLHPNDGSYALWGNPYRRGPLHPGESFTQDFGYGFEYGEGGEVACVNVTYRFVVYTNNTAESADDKMLQNYIEGALGCAQTTDIAVQAAKDMLNAKVQHPFRAFIKVADQRHYNLNVEAYKANQQEKDDDAKETSKLQDLIATHQEVSKLCTKRSHVKVVGQ